MKFTKSAVVAATFAALVSMTNGALAADAPGTGPNPFSDCGIGAALFSETKWAAVTSNIIWDVGTTAVTSGTMSPHTCSGKQVKVALFINDTYAKLAEETAAGQGEHLSAVLNLAECGQAQQSKAMESLRGAMASVVMSNGYSEKSHLEKATAMYFAVEKATANSCAA